MKAFYRKLLSLGVLFFLVCPVSALWAQSMTPVAIDRQAAEQDFLKGYSYFLDNHLWNSLDSIRAARKKNTFFVDTYFLESLVLRKLGRYPEAIRAMQFYLEVRRLDYRGRMILSSMEEEWERTKKILYPGHLDANIRFKIKRAGDFLPRVNLFHPIIRNGLKGMGKVSQSASLLYIPDMLGDRLWVFNQRQDPWQGQLNIASPSVVIPLTLDEALLVQKSGDVHKIRVDEELNKIHIQYQGGIPSNVADAVAISSTTLAIADRTGSVVRFCSYPSLREEITWSPEEERTNLFEPVALAEFGPLLAVADRGNGIISVLDTYTLKVRDQFALDRPRDLIWGDQGELYILLEDGSLHVRFPVSEKNTKTEMLVDGMRNAWSVAWLNGAPLIGDIVGRIWWNGYPVLPGKTPHTGTVNFGNLSVEGKKGSETLVMVGTVGSIFHDFVAEQIPVSQVVWRDEVRPAPMTEEIRKDDQLPWYYVAENGNHGLSGAVVVPGLNEMMKNIEARARRKEKLPRVLVLDSRVDATQAQLVAFLPFLLQQGIRLDLMEMGRPASIMLKRLSRLTRGVSFYTWPTTGVLPNDTLNWVVRIPLPPEPVTFGFPSDATLSFFADVHSIQFRDWLPIWPTLLKRK